MKRNADIFDFPSRPERVRIAGRTYALSDIGVPVASLEAEEGSPDEGARMVDMGGNPWRYIWVYEPGSERLEMYRYSDGDWKVLGSPGDYPDTFRKLDQMGHLNVVTVDEMDEFEREMRRRYDDAISALRASIESDKTSEDERVEQLVAQFFRERVAPGLRRRWQEIAQGVFPFDFEVNERIPRPAEEQARMHVLHDELERAGYLKGPMDDYVVAGLGYSDVEELEDLQSIDWAARDFLQVAYTMAERG